MNSRPNILYVFTDQQSAHAMSCAGNEDLKTPAMDELAESGVRFTNAYTSYPLCTPARASMFTGVTPHQCGVLFNDFEISEKYKPFEMGHVFTKAGYECVYGGKWHVPELEIPEGHGFENICGFTDTPLADACIEFLKKKHEKPFLMVASFDNPHNICEYYRNEKLPWGPVVEPENIEDCPNLPPNFNVSPYEPEAIAIEQDSHKKIYATGNFTPDDWRKAKFAYYRLVEKVDQQIGRILDALRDEGLEENTLIVFTSDHGDCNGAHQLPQKTVLYDESVRVPFIISFKGVTKAGQVNDSHLISSCLDLFPTFCDYAGITAPDGIEGLSLRSLAEGDDAPDWRDQLVTETCFHRSTYNGTDGRMLLTKDYKYCVYSWGKYKEQLFDRNKDPYEITNLAVNSKYDAVLKECRKRLKRWIDKTEDFFLVPSYEYDR